MTDKMNGEWTICFDTLIDGYTAVHDGEDNPITYESEAEAIAELESDPEFYEDCFVCRTEEIGHKTIYRTPPTTQKPGGMGGM